MRICKKCDQKHFCRGFCRYHYNRSKYKKADDLRWKTNNRKKYLQMKKDHRIKFKQYYKQYNKQYQITHRKQINETNKKYRKRYPDRVFEYNKKRMSKISIIFNMDRLEYKIALISWSEMIKFRDNYICQWCKSKNNLKSHHILPKSIFPEDSLKLENGITLCHDCHVVCHRLIV